MIVVKRKINVVQVGLLLFEIDLQIISCAIQRFQMPFLNGIWGEAKYYNVAIGETETVTNSCVLGADPLVSGIGEEDMLTLVLPMLRPPAKGLARLREDFWKV